MDSLLDAPIGTWDFTGGWRHALLHGSTPPYYGRCFLATVDPKGYISPTAGIYHQDLRLGKHVFIGDRVIIYRARDGGGVEIGTRSYLYGETIIHTGSGGSLRIGANSHIHPKCHIMAYKSKIQIGDEVQIASNCAFYPYDHGVDLDAQINEQPLSSKGDIIIQDDVWLGYGVIVLSGVRIGKGAVVGAGSVVSKSIPDNGIAVGVPAKVIKIRSKKE